MGYGAGVLVPTNRPTVGASIPEHRRQLWREGRLDVSSGVAVCVPSISPSDFC